MLVPELKFITRDKKASLLISSMSSVSFVAFDPLRGGSKWYTQISLETIVGLGGESSESDEAS
jgi:hypothetical protein